MKLLYRHLAPLFFASFSLAAQAEGGSAQPKVKLTTNHGDIVIALNAEKAPETVKNFIQYVESGFYDGTDPHSATAQFFINTKDNDFLNYRGKTMQDWGYAVFGEVIEGMDVVDAIRKVKTTMRGGHQDVPADAVVIQALQNQQQNGSKIYLMQGNRDFMLGEGFARLVGGILLDDPVVVSLYGHSILLMHGDSLKYFVQAQAGG